MKIAFPSTAVAIALLTGVLSASSVSADENQGFYVSLFGGWQDRDRSGESAVTYTEFDNGWLVSLAAGYRYNTFRFEGEFTAFENDTKTVASEPTGPQPGRGSVSGEAWMVNGYYDIPLENLPIKPYVGLGIGVYQTKLKDLTNDVLASVPAEFGGPFIFNGSSDHPFAWQLKLGATYVVNDNFDLALGYRYFKGDDLTFTGTQLGELNPSGAEFHAIEAGLRYKF